MQQRVTSPLVLGSSTHVLASTLLLQLRYTIHQIVFCESDKHVFAVLFFLQEYNQLASNQCRGPDKQPVDFFQQ